MTRYQRNKAVSREWSEWVAQGGIRTFAAMTEALELRRADARSLWEQFDKQDRLREARAKEEQEAIDRQVASCKAVDVENARYYQ